MLIDVSHDLNHLDDHRMLLEDLANPDPFDLDFYGPAAGLDELLASHKSDQSVS